MPLPSAQGRSASAGPPATPRRTRRSLAKHPGCRSFARGCDGPRLSRPSRPLCAPPGAPVLWTHAGPQPQTPTFPSLPSRPPVIMPVSTRGPRRTCDLRYSPSRWVCVNPEWPRPRGPESRRGAAGHRKACVNVGTSDFRRDVPRAAQREATGAGAVSAPFSPSLPCPRPWGQRGHQGAGRVEKRWLRCGCL